MTSNRARLPSRPAQATTPLAGIALGLVMSLSCAAQDTNAGDCAVNGNSDIENCASTPEVRDREQSYPLDWVPIDALPEDIEPDRQCINCQGRYLDPLRDEDKDATPDLSHIHAHANSSQLLGNEVTLDGGVSAAQGYRRMSGDKIVVDRENESAVISGNVTLREPGVLMQGEEAEVFSKTGEATISNGQFVFHDRHLRGDAHLLERDSDGLVHIHDGDFSFCAPGEDEWAVHAGELELDFDEGLATARDARIEVEGTPVFYTPWLRFPLDDRRRTGFLWPDFGNDSTGGLDITVPFYINLAPNYDALYAPRFIEERGLNHELQLRYLNPLVGAWTVGGAYMNNDDRYESQVPDHRSTDRWLGVVKQSGLFNQRWRSRVDYSKASDVDYMKDLQTSSLDSQRKTSLLQLASMDYLGDSWLLNLEAQQFQSLADDINDDYKKLPQFTAQYRGKGTPFQLEPVFLAQYSNFDTDENRVTGQRIYAEAGTRYPMLWNYGFLTPEVKYRQLNYELSDLVLLEDDNPSSGAALANIDGGLYFERQTSVGGRGLLQTLEPRVYYLYSQYEEQFDQPDFDSAELTFSYNQLFRQTRFSGRDRLDDANQLSLGLTTRFIDNMDGRSLLSASIGHIFYFRDRKVRLSPLAEPLDDEGSEIAGGLNFTPDDRISVTTNLVYSPYSDRMNSGNIQTSYHWDNGGIINLGYNYRRPITTLTSVVNQTPTKEANISTYLPLGNNWSVFAGMNYSTQTNESVEDMFGVEYDSCCWTVRLLHLRYYNNDSGSVIDLDDPNLERESSTQFQIVLKGMGGFGDRITDIMEDMIRGYDEREI